MSFHPDDIIKVAHLARLSVSDQEIPAYTDTLSKIIDLVDSINKADTEGVTPMAHPFETMTQRLRDDKITEGNEQEAFQSIAPKTESGLYLVPKVLEGKDE